MADPEAARTLRAEVVATAQAPSPRSESLPRWTMPRLLAGLAAGLMSVAALLVAVLWARHRVENRQKAPNF